MIPLLACTPENAATLTTLTRIDEFTYAWPSGQLAVFKSVCFKSLWCATVDGPNPHGADHFDTPEECAAAIGARLPLAADGGDRG